MAAEPMGRSIDLSRLMLWLYASFARNSLCLVHCYDWDGLALERNCVGTAAFCSGGRACFHIVSVAEHLNFSSVSFEQ